MKYRIEDSINATENNAWWHPSFPCWHFNAEMARYIYAGIPASRQKVSATFVVIWRMPAWYYYLSKDCIRRMEYSGIGEPPYIECFQDVG
jgi:hypothetical protein